MSKPCLKDILLADAKGAKSGGFDHEVLPAGEYVAKIINFTEEDTYNYVAVEINGKRFNMFYNYYIRDTTDLNGDVINWIKELATIKTTDKTTLLEVSNSAIGCSYKISIYNYVSKTGKNKGKSQHAISFSDLPVIDTTVVTPIEEEDLDLPF